VTVASQIVFHFREFTVGEHAVPLGGVEDKSSVIDHRQSETCDTAPLSFEIGKGDPEGFRHRQAEIDSVSPNVVCAK
jgi:hypothetical protein